MFDILLLATITGLAIALVAAPLGCFIVWRRLAYFSDTLSHSALLGVALGFIWGINLTVSVLASSVALAIILMLLQSKRHLNNDSILAILAHTNLALGIITISLNSDANLNLNSYLFGDLLSINGPEAALIVAVAATLLALIIKLWPQLLAATVHEELAKIEGIAVERLKLFLIIALALLIAIAMKIVGVLLVSALLIIPAASARRFATSPEMMAVYAAIIGCCSILLGLVCAWHFDTPAGPSIVATAGLIFFLCQTLKTRV